ncbi:type II toxin-antitoxin system VapC family toxin [bacterium]|nr:type II toxin-antitoxin system VapC family toxin [bacterium]
MKAVLLDTHVWAWSLTGDYRLSERATKSMTEADRVLISPISFFEIGQKVRLGKWPEMEPWVDKLATLVEEQGGLIADLDPVVCLSAGTMSWAHRDPFDRLLAATAARYSLPIISADAVFDGFVPRIW